MTRTSHLCGQRPPNPSIKLAMPPRRHRARYERHQITLLGCPTSISRCTAPTWRFPRAPPDVVRLRSSCCGNALPRSSARRIQQRLHRPAQNTIDWAWSVNGDPVWPGWTRSFRGKVVGAQRIQRRSGRTAVTKPPGAAAHQPGMLVIAARFALGQTVVAFDGTRSAGAGSAPPALCRA